MIEFRTSYKPRIAISLDNKVEVTFTTTKAAIKALDGLKDKEYTITLKEWKPRRSLSQNAYMWGLINELAIKLDRSKEDIYKMYIKDYGVFDIVPIREDAKASFINRWTKNGMGWFVEELGESKIKGYTNIIAYSGSSTYTSTEMHRLINAVIDDCKDQGINTMTYEEIMKLQNENDTH